SVSTRSSTAWRFSWALEVGLLGRAWVNKGSCRVLCPIDWRRGGRCECSPQTRKAGYLHPTLRGPRHRKAHRHHHRDPPPPSTRGTSIPCSATWSSSTSTADGSRHRTMVAMSDRP